MPEAQGAPQVHGHPKSSLGRRPLLWGGGPDLHAEAPTASFRQKCADSAATNSSESRSSPALHPQHSSSTSLRNQISNVCKRAARIHHVNLSHSGGEPGADSASSPTLRPSLNIDFGVILASHRPCYSPKAQDCQCPHEYKCPCSRAPRQSSTRSFRGVTCVADPKSLGVYQTCWPEQRIHPSKISQRSL